MKSSKNELEVIYKSLGDYKDVYEFLNKVILDNNVSNVKEGGFVDPNYNAELSELSYMLNNGNKLIIKLRSSYRDLTDIATLKILHNNILGYYIEASSNHKMTSYILIHRQGLASSSRTTPPN